jgi:hypothetical protein
MEKLQAVSFQAPANVAAGALSAVYLEDRPAFIGAVLHMIA